MAWRLANNDRLDQIANDRHQAALGLLVGIVARQEDQLADGVLGIGRIELRPQLRNFLLKIFRRPFSGGEFLDQLLTGDFQFVELVVEDSETWPAFGVPVLDLLHQARLLRLDRRKLAGQLVLMGRRILQLAHLMRDHPLRDPVENVQ
ncbi:hypothetical protein ACCS62_28280 [Rhizobium ruizarguesonis]